jgi:hypothetical protein
MSDRISPPSKPVSKKDGFSMPSGHSTITTPNPTFGKYWGSGQSASTAKETTKLMGKK